MTNPLRSNIEDRAVALAKRFSHEEVEGRHVLVAIGEELELPLPRTIDELLAPPGDAIGPPRISDDAAAVLAECTSRDSAAGVFRQLVDSLGVETAVPATAAGKQGASKTASPGGTKRPVEDVLDELESLVGLGSVKEAVHRLVDLHRLNQERASRDLPTMQGGLNLVFTGSPGTGKTTVARLVAQLYHSLGLLPRGHLVEVHRADLVAAYVGQTALRVEQVVKQTLGGVLFIDEAYALASADLDDYGTEAVATLVKLMEDHRSELAVIVAGYPQPMERFIQSNPGLQSRFQQFIHFPDYADAELEEIFVRRAAEYRLEVPEATRRRVRAVIAGAPTRVRSGNGRFIRNLLGESYARMAARANADGVIEEDEIRTLEPEDIPEPGPDTAEPAPGMYL